MHGHKTRQEPTIRPVDPLGLEPRSMAFWVVAFLALATDSAPAAVQRQVSPYAGFAGMEARLEALAPVELAAYRESATRFEEARSALRDAAPESFDAAAAVWRWESGLIPPTATEAAAAEYERWAEVLEAADPGAYATGRFVADVVGRVVGTDATDAVDEDLAEVLILLIRAYAADRLEAAERKMAAEGPKAETALRGAAPAEWAIFEGVSAELAKAGAALREMAPKLAADYLEAEVRIRRTQNP